MHAQVLPGLLQKHCAMKVSVAASAVDSAATSPADPTTPSTHRAAFAAGEWAAFFSGGVDLDAFLVLWAAKEAFAKALGQGLAYDLSRVEFVGYAQGGRGPFASEHVVLDGRVDRRDVRRGDLEPQAAREVLEAEVHDGRVRRPRRAQVGGWFFGKRQVPVALVPSCAPARASDPYPDPVSRASRASFTARTLATAFDLFAESTASSPPVTSPPATARARRAIGGLHASLGRS